VLPGSAGSWCRPGRRGAAPPTVPRRPPERPARRRLRGQGSRALWR